MSKSGRAMIDALVAGERNPIVLADLAKKRMHSKIPQLQRALVGRFGAHHAAMLRLHLAHIDQLDALIEVIDEQLDAKLVPFADDLRRVQSITGVGPTTAQVEVAGSSPVVPRLRSLTLARSSARNVRRRRCLRRPFKRHGSFFVGARRQLLWVRER